MRGKRIWRQGNCTCSSITWHEWTSWHAHLLHTVHINSHYSETAIHFSQLWLTDYLFSYYPFLCPQFSALSWTIEFHVSISSLRQTRKENQQPDVFYSLPFILFIHLFSSVMFCQFSRSFFSAYTHKMLCPYSSLTNYCTILTCCQFVPVNSKKMTSSSSSHHPNIMTMYHKMLSKLTSSWLKLTVKWSSRLFCWFVYWIYSQYSDNLKSISIKSSLPWHDVLFFWTEYFKHKKCT